MRNRNYSSNILVIGMTENPGGVESVIMNHFRRFRKQGIRADFLSYDEHIAYEDEIRAAGSRIFVMKSRRQNPLGFRPELYRFFTQHGGEWDTLWMNACNLSNIDFLSVAEQCGIGRRIIHCHNSRPMDHSVLRNVLHSRHRKTVLKYATDLWSCSNVASCWFYGPNIFEDARYTYVPNAIDPSQYCFDSEIRQAKRRELGIKPNEIVLGNVGRLHMQKNQTLIVTMMRKLLDADMKDKQYRALIIGDGENRDALETLARKLQVENHVSFLGERTDMREIYQAFDIFLLPSLFEGVSIALLEAQSNGLPCLISDTLSDEGIVNDNVCKLPISTTRGCSAPDIWAEKILQLGPHPPRKATVQIVGSAYDINQQDSLFA